MARKITDEDLANRGVMGLPDVPGLTAIEMQKKLEEIPREVIIPRYNELVDSVADICEEFSKLSTYDVGDYCIYENVLYKCTTAITTEGEWDATKWKATSIDKELKEISSYTANKDVISDKYDSSKTYAVGDYCIYNDTLYKCKTAVTSAEEFDSSKWEPTNCGKEFEVLNSNFNYQMAEQKVGTWYNGKTIYRRIFTFTIDSANYNYITDLPISYVDDYWMGSESFKKYDTGRCSPVNLPHSNPVSASACFPSVGTTNIEICTRNGTSETTGHYLVVLYYTKA